MNLWEFLDRRAERRANKKPRWGVPDERGWLVILAWVTFVYVLSLVAFVPDLDKSQLFTALASGVAGAVFRDVIGMWTSATKAGSEMAAANAQTVQAMTTQTPPALVVQDADSIKVNSKEQKG